MKPTLDHNIEASVFLWLDNLLVEKGRGFKTETGTFVSTTPEHPGLATYSAPHRQFVSDYTVSGAIVPTGVYTNGTFRPVGTGLQLDFSKGLALFPSAPTTPVSGVYSYKELNVYLTNKSEQEVLFESIYKQAAKYGQPFTGYSSSDVVYPCVFLRTSVGKNNKLCFEGASESKMPVRLIVLADSEYQYKSVMSMLRDNKDKFLPIFQPENLPYNEYNNVRVPFDYSASGQILQNNPYNLAKISDVTVSNFTYRVNNLIGKDVVAGFCDMELHYYGFPHFR